MSFVITKVCLGKNGARFGRIDAIYPCIGIFETPALAETYLEKEKWSKKRTDESKFLHQVFGKETLGYLDFVWVKWKGKGNEKKKFHAYIRAVVRPK